MIVKRSQISVNKLFQIYHSVVDTILEIFLILFFLEVAKLVFLMQTTWRAHPLCLSQLLWHFEHYSDSTWNIICFIKRPQITLFLLVLQSQNAHTLTTIYFNRLTNAIFWLYSVAILKSIIPSYCNIAGGTSTNISVLHLV